MRKHVFASIVLLPFTALSLFALWQVGYIGLFQFQLQSAAGWQVLADLVIALVMVLSWMVPELKKAGYSPVPWIGLTLILGSFGPLFYLAFFRNKVLQTSAARA